MGPKCHGVNESITTAYNISPHELFADFHTNANKNVTEPDPRQKKKKNFHYHPLKCYSLSPAVPEHLASVGATANPRYPFKVVSNVTCETNSFVRELARSRSASKFSNNGCCFEGRFGYGEIQFYRKFAFFDDENILET